MWSFFKKLFPKQEEPKWENMSFGNLIIIDVRSPGEFASGHVANAINIPVSEINDKYHQINKDKMVILYCASGMRSGAAKRILKAKGFNNLYNGGNANNVQNKLAGHK
jgi:phage shock protein E